MSIMNNMHVAKFTGLFLGLMFLHLSTAQEIAAAIPPRTDASLSSNTSDFDQNNSILTTTIVGSYYLATTRSSPPPPMAFQEIWAYVMASEQDLAKYNYPISDLAYFAAGINDKGELFGGGPLPRKESSEHFRHHLVVAESSNAAVLHFVLSPDFPLRDKLVQDLAAKAGDYDGIQIDFESIAAYDGENFLAFLALLKAALPDKILSIALPARHRFVNDAFDYSAIAPLVDRAFIMAYDEHWSGSKPGSIASMAWCKSVADYANKVIGSAKVIMGMPFYGRIWGEKSPVGAYRFGAIERLSKEKTDNIQRDAEGIPYFNFSTTINYTAYYEDSASISQRAKLYQNSGIGKIGFWRLGQEDPAIWKNLQLGP